MRARTVLGAALVGTLLACPGRAEEPVRLPTTDAVLDRNGDGFQDVIVLDRIAHHDVDFDGRFDFTLSLAFREYSSEGHLRYLASSFSPGVFAELTRAGLDTLCANEQMAARWTAAHFSEFLYYHDGYGALRIFDDSPGNDGRLAGRKAVPRYEYRVSFNPDGTVATVQRGDRTITLAAFDYDGNTSSGTILRLPRIGRREDLAAVRAELGALFEAAPGKP